MNIWDYVILAALAVCAFFGLRHWLRSRKDGCCGNCAQCKGCQDRIFPIEK